MEQFANLNDIQRLLRKHWRKAIFVFAVTVATSVLLALLSQPVYEANSSVLIRFGREFLYAPEVGEDRPRSIYINPASVVRTEVEILTSRDLAQRLLEKIGHQRLYPDIVAVKPDDDVTALAIDEFHDNLSVVSDESSDVIRIMFRHPDRDLVATTVNDLVACFREKHLDTFRDPDILKFLDRMVVELGEDLVDSEQQLDSYRQKNHVYDSVAQLKMLVDQRAQTEQALNDVSLRIAEINEQMSVCSDEIAKVDNFFASKVNNPYPTRASANEVHVALSQSLLDLRTELLTSQARESQLQKQLATVNENLHALSEHEREIRRMARMVTAGETNYLDYVKKLEDARISAEMDRQRLTNIRVVQTATRPQEAIGYGKRAKVAIGVVIGAILALAVVFMSEYLPTRWAQHVTEEALSEDAIAVRPR